MVGVAPSLKQRPADPTRALLGLTEWKTAAQAGLDPSSLWRAVEDDLLVYASSSPRHRLAGTPGALDGYDGRLARRAAVWPTVAVENAVEIAPMPFMPRGRDLEGAETVGVRLASLERGHEVLGLTVTGTRVTGQRLRTLWPLLNGRHSRTEILDSFGRRDRGAVEKLLRLFDDLGLLERVDGPPPPADGLVSVDRPQVCWLGHAAVLIQTPTTNVLVDPLFFAPSDPPDRWDSHRRFDPRALPKLDAILVTHGDNDHLNPNSLGLLDRDVPVLLPACAPHPAAFQVDVKGMLRVLGFRTLIEMAPGTGHRVGDLHVSAWPFDGEDWGLDLAQVTYLVEGEGLSTYLSADARRMDDVMTAIAARDRQVDLAFFGVSANAEPHVTAPDLGYGNFYADWIPREKHNEWVQHCAGPEDGVESARRLRPRYAFGYAAGGASFIRTAYSDHGDNEMFARLLDASGLDTVPVNLPLGEPVAIDDLTAHRF